jgi:hypothetical protein
MEQKIKCCVVVTDDFPGGLVHQNREDALAMSKDERESGNQAYTHVKYFTKEALEALPEAD